MKTGTEKESGSGSGNWSWDGNWDGDGDGIRDETDTETKAEREDGDGNRAGIIISLALKTLPIVSGGSRGGVQREEGGGGSGRVTQIWDRLVTEFHKILKTNSDHV